MKSAITFFFILAMCIIAAFIFIDNDNDQNYAQ